MQKHVLLLLPPLSNGGCGSRGGQDPCGWQVPVGSRGEEHLDELDLAPEGLLGLLARMYLGPSTESSQCRRMTCRTLPQTFASVAHGCRWSTL